MPRTRPRGAGHVHAVSMAYTGEQFREFLRTGIAFGGRELAMMSPLARDRYASFTDHEIDALHAYLRTLAATELGYVIWSNVLIGVAATALAAISLFGNPNPRPR
jgi:hypothetical protein